MIKLFFHSGTGQHYLVFSENPFIDCYCGVTHKEGDELVYVSRYYKDNSSENLIFCDKCFVKNYRKRHGDNIREVIISSFVPDNSKLVMEAPIILKQSGVSSFDAATSNKGISADTSSTVVMDKTKLSGKPGGSWLGSKVGDRSLVDKKDKEQESIGADEMLDSLRYDFVPVVRDKFGHEILEGKIEDKEKKKITDGFD